MWFLTAQWALFCDCVSLSGLHTAKCATPGKVLESGVLTAFSASSWVATGKWTVFRQSDQAPGSHTLWISFTTCLGDCFIRCLALQVLAVCHPLVFHLQMSYHLAQPGS